MYVVCVDLSKYREVLFQGSMFMMYTACAGWFLYTFARSLVHQSPSPSVCCLLSCLQLSLRSSRTSLGSVGEEE